MLSNKKHRLSCKIWIEYKGKPVIGEGGAEILGEIEKVNSISKAAENLGMSYRYVWNYLQDIQAAVEAPIIETYKGGKSGGGGAKLTDLGRSLLAEYQQVATYLENVLCNPNSVEVNDLKLSARNQFKGKVLSVEKGVITAKVKIEISTPLIVTSVITMEAVEELKLKTGDEINAVVKATEIMIGK